MALAVQEDGKVYLTFDEYMDIVDVCEMVESNTESLSLHDEKLKFGNSHIWPTVEQLDEHNVADNFLLYFPYLVYYGDVYQCDDPAFKKTEEYIHHLFNEKLVIKEES